MDLFSSNVGSIHGNMLDSKFAQVNAGINNANNQLADTITGLKEQQKENEYLSSAKNLVSSAYSGGAYNTKLEAYKKFVDEGGQGLGLKQAGREAVQEIRSTGEGLRDAGKGIKEAVFSKSPLDEHISTSKITTAGEMGAEGRTGLSHAEHVEEMGSKLIKGGLQEGEEFVGKAGNLAGKLGKGLGIAGGLATGGMALFDDFKGGNFHLQGDNTAEKIANAGQIIGAGLDVIGTVAPPIALIGGAVDILSGIIGGVGSIEEGGEKEKELDKQGEQQKQKLVAPSVVGSQQITTGRTI
jgi:hypothetical protein